MGEGDEETSLAGQLAVVTGGGRGIGRDVAVGLAAQGMRLVVCGRSLAPLEATATHIRSEGNDANAMSVDVQHPSAAAALHSRISSQLGRVSVVVNAAGVFGPLARIEESDCDEWIATQSTNLIGPYLMCREFVPEMVEAGWGRIINVSSSAGLSEPEPFNSAYAVSKVALNRFTRQLALELEGSGVTANAIHPGSLKTDMWDDIRQKVDALGAEAGGHAEWVELVERTGGDSPSEAVALVLRVVCAPSSVNGLFHWPEGGLERQLPSW
jgi:NAD(P)-dependent dehydrogenase (short-subunit alcohol dehydrogenase family)